VVPLAASGASIRRVPLSVLKPIVFVSEADDLAFLGSEGLLKFSNFGPELLILPPQARNRLVSVFVVVARHCPEALFNIVETFLQHTDAYTGLRADSYTNTPDFSGKGAPMPSLPGSMTLSCASGRHSAIPTTLPSWSSPRLSATRATLSRAS
jgi:hypothetical protein